MRVRQRIVADTNCLVRNGSRKQNTARLGTWTADLLHVAAALDLRADYLYTFDQQQRKLAQTVGMKVN
jgi:predicted nucleic acid-binding protein